MYCDTRGTDKNQPGQTPRTKPPPTIETEFVQRTFVRDFCIRPTKNRGVRDVWRTFGGVPECVTKCDRGEGGQNWPKIAWCTLWTAPQLAVDKDQGIWGMEQTKSQSEFRWQSERTWKKSWRFGNSLEEDGTWRWKMTVWQRVRVNCLIIIVINFLLLMQLLSDW